ncbi:hypothetical protein BJ878DRAFT_83427 [Calycina marina]|uniref:2EXR domain-containing protein n=1 Tax=Calycina marina TaxID=1763456 RepID=A0A9P8CIB5_9HELO|nr:hypothetical protein BJ878DRAFT_83427 [Calycina marina]
MFLDHTKLVEENAKFALFSQFAPEIRFDIWKYACAERTISLRYLLEKDICVTTTKPPGVLHACHESRMEALKVYSLFFGTHSMPARIYFNPRLDTLHLPRHRPMGYDDTLRDFRYFLDDDTVLNEVKTVAIDHVDVDVRRPWEAYNKLALLRTLPNLKELVLVVGEVQGTGEGDVTPQEQAQTMTRIWAAFCEIVAIEEKGLKDGCKDTEMDHVKWQLPRIFIRSYLNDEVGMLFRETDFTAPDHVSLSSIISNKIK